MSAHTMSNLTPVDAGILLALLALILLAIFANLRDPGHE